MKPNFKVILPIIGGIVFTAFALSTVGINDAGYRTVIQYPNGGINIKFDPGWYFDWGGRTTVYKDVITYDFDEELNDDDEAGTIETQGIKVRYQDGGEGAVFGKVQFTLPDDEVTMRELHNTYRSNNGLANKLLKPVTREAAQLTAGLMTSEEAYAEKRADYGNDTRAQVENGKYRTRLETKTVDVATGRFDENGAPVMDTQETKVPVIMMGSDGLPRHEKSAIKDLGLGIVGFQITNWAFEQRTLDQIQAKRQANMAIITAQANANKAEFEKLEVIAEGQKNVEASRYEEEKEKIRQIVIAEREASKRVIEAQANVSVNEQNKLAAAEDLEAAKLEKQATIARGEGEARAKELVMQADGALQRKLDAYVAVQQRFAEAIEKQSWVPHISMGGNGSANGGENASQLIQLLEAKTAKDLSLDTSVK